MAVNKLLKAIAFQIEKNPTSLEVHEALFALKNYQKIRLQVEDVFTSFVYGVRVKQIDQYFQIRRLLECFEITFPRRAIIQRTDVAAFPMEWKGNRSAVLYWTTGDGWSVGHKDYVENELNGVWEGFDLEDILQANDLCFTEYADD